MKFFVDDRVHGRRRIVQARDGHKNTYKYSLTLVDVIRGYNEDEPLEFKDSTKIANVLRSFYTSGLAFCSWTLSKHFSHLDEISYLAEQPQPPAKRSHFLRILIR
ncbi:hypothetical protein CHS0354_015689 [Potamilus streckersoni]|uniref:Uncharacterized protein n=1 Tax=Potamilus streckersoni TaxID=2493646 RepID=A0AAE0VZV3_9BIVA|nr:hypothetical protein CHS0354_015689 [Potamilus streckersoni]